MDKSVSFKLTAEDIKRYEKQIAEIDLNIERELLQKIPYKVEALLKYGKLSSIQLSLVLDISKLIAVLGNFPDLELPLRRMILFALQYFYNPEDDIPDNVVDLGFLDDAILVRWVIDQVMVKYPEYFQA